MQRLRQEDGYLGYIGIMAALVIAALLMSTQLKLFTSSSGGGTSGAGSDAAAQAEVQHAYAALQRCAQSQGGRFDGCGERIVENEPTLAPAAGRIKATAAGPSAQVTVASSTGNSFTIAIDNGATVRSCTKPGAGSCPASGSW